LAERVSARGLNVMTMVVAATTVAFLTQVDGPVSAFIFAILFGTNARGAAVLGQILIARYYGRLTAAVRSAPSAASSTRSTKAASESARCSPARRSITSAIIG
jgi:hypothetical protein